MGGEPVVGATEFAEFPAAGVRRRPRIGGWLAVAAGIAVAVAVVVVVIAAGGHRHQVQQTAAPSTCTRQLLGELGVLRRPQTQADRALAPVPVPPGIDQSNRASFPYAPVPGLTRLARALPDGSRVFLAVYAPLPGSLAAPVGDTVFVFVTAARTNGSGVGGKKSARRLSPSFAGETSAPLLSSSYQLPPTQSGDVYLSVVPDKVARVQWTFPREQLPNLPHVDAGHVFPGGTLTANVVGNIAAAAAIPHAFFMVSRATWLNAAGRTIRTFRYAVTDLAKMRLPSGPTRLTSTATAHGSVIQCARP